MMTPWVEIEYFIKTNTVSVIKMCQLHYSFYIIYDTTACLVLRHVIQPYLGFYFRYKYMLAKFIIMCSQLNFPCITLC